MRKSVIPIIKTKKAIANKKPIAFPPLTNKCMTLPGLFSEQQLKSQEESIKRASHDKEANMYLK